MRKIILLIISSAFFVGLLVACSNDKASNTITKKDEIGITAEGEPINLYFSDSSAEYLIGEERNIEDVTPQKAIQALIEGPKNKELRSSLPKELEISDVSIKDGIAYVYIHESVPLAKHGNYGSSAVTRHIINSISATLILNEEFGIKKVKLEGDIGDILYGVDMNSLFDIDMNLIKSN